MHYQILDRWRWCILLGLAVFTFTLVHGDKPCAARPIEGQSVVCVCTANYCDEVLREHPAGPNHYIAYTSSEGGMRFKKSYGVFEELYDIELYSHTCSASVLKLDPETKYQTIEGFGAAATDAAAINWMSMSEGLKKKMVESYFGKTGIEYSMVRVPIGGSDFSTRPYAYNEYPEEDENLTNYTLSYEDYEYKIPFLHEINKTSVNPVHIIATTWSPPTWMKSNEEFSGVSYLKKKYLQTYADYHYKFFEKYLEYGIEMWGMTTTNEPINGVIPVVQNTPFNSLGWHPGYMGEWIANHLGPTIRNSIFKDIQILTVDDQRYTIPYWFNFMVSKHPESLKYIDGVAVHYYGDNITPPDVLKFVTENHPTKYILSTEACEGGFPWEKQKVLLGSWKRADSYINDIFSNLNHHVVGWMDWNLCLDKQGGPNWSGNFVDSPVIVFPEKGEFIKQPMFYAMGHFSKFIPRGSKRINLIGESYICSAVRHTAFLTPQDTIVVVLYNMDRSKTVSLRLGNKQIVLQMETNSITTLEFENFQT